MQHYTIKGTELGKDVYVEPVEEFEKADINKPIVHLNFKLVNGIAKIIKKEEK